MTVENQLTQKHIDRVADSVRRVIKSDADNIKEQIKVTVILMHCPIVVALGIIAGLILRHDNIADYICASIILSISLVYGYRQVTQSHRCKNQWMIINELSAKWSACSSYQLLCDLSTMSKLYIDYISIKLGSEREERALKSLINQFILLDQQDRLTGEWQYGEKDNQVLLSYKFLNSAEKELVPFKCRVVYQKDGVEKLVLEDGMTTLITSVNSKIK